MDETALEKLRTRIRGLRAKTLENGCTEAEALLAAAKVAELIDLYDLSLTDIEIRASQCERRDYEDARRKRVPIGDCIGAIAGFSNCRVWREKGAEKSMRFVFFGLPADVDAALFLTELIDHALRHELGQFKISSGYRDFRHAERHLANASFLLGMAGSIGEKLLAMLAERQSGGGRDMVVLKTARVDAELKAMNLHLREVTSTPRMIAPDAYAAGEAAGTALPIGKQ